jgi:hypothetical protein
MAENASSRAADPAAATLCWAKTSDAEISATTINGQAVTLAEASAEHAARGWPAKCGRYVGRLT